MAFSSHSIYMSGSGVLGRELKKLKKLKPLWPLTALIIFIFFYFFLRIINSLNLIIENNFQFCFRIIDNLFMESMFRYKFYYI